MSRKIYSLAESGNHVQWFLEGDGRIEIASDGALRLSTVDTKLVWPKTPPCCTLWLKEKLPDEYLIEYDFALEDGSGASIAFIDAQGVMDADIFSWSRSAGWEGYADLGLMRMYTLSFGRIDSPGVNMRKLWAPGGNEEPSPIISTNPVDPCTEVGTYYHHRIEKSGNYILMTIDDEVIHEYTDDGAYGPPLQGGWFAVRNFRHARTTLWKNLVVTAQ
jgi:hypothetical protein